MVEWAVKQFWTTAGVEETEGGFSILLDKRAIKTPAKALFLFLRVLWLKK